jgi:hypothetical protein
MKDRFVAISVLLFLSTYILRSWRMHRSPSQNITEISLKRNKELGISFNFVNETSFMDISVSLYFRRVRPQVHMVGEIEIKNALLS